MKKTILALVLAVVAFPALADEDGWFSTPNTTDWVLQGVSTSLLLADWAQTTNFLNSSYYQQRGIYETNVFLGRHPSNRELNRYMAANIAGNALIAWALPRPWRTLFQVGTIGVEIYAVGYCNAAVNHIKLTVKF